MRPHETHFVTVPTFAVAAVAECRKQSRFDASTVRYSSARLDSGPAVARPEYPLAQADSAPPDFPCGCLLRSPVSFVPAHQDGNNRDRRPEGCSDDRGSKGTLERTG